ncbi:MAG TPA: GMC family oxidoreductase N-terminal domain-containing protein [Steroidobacteraceae bacterium]|nr:GMC family oxidoreductase N-terminal domain-containing protein [Steroidobacteraceae bacterium]
MSEFDYLIIGAGTAGCVLAARLSEDPAVQVCLIEAGPRDTHPFIQVPALVGAAIGRPQLNWRFMTEPQPQLDNRRIPLPRGRVVGGSGSINGMAYFRGQPLDFDDWAAAGCKGWSWREVLPYFIRSENNEDHRGSPLHGQGGPINVRHIRRPNRLNRAFLEAFASLREYPPCADLNGARPEGFGLRQGTIRNGRRDSTANAYLRPALARPNLTVLADSLVTRILIENGAAAGAEIKAAGGAPQQLRARREVVLSAGTVQSPQLLMLSGIGDADELRPHGIRVLQHLPGVGGNYHDHLAVSVLMETRNTLSYGLSFRTAHRAAWNLLQYLAWRDGPLASNLFESTAFIRSSAQSDRPDLQIVFQPARRNRGTFPLPLGHGFAISSVGLYPRSRGRVHLAGADPAAPPRVAANFLADPQDIQPLLHGLKLARRLFASEPFHRYAAHEVAPGPAVTDDAGLAAYVRRVAATAHHPVGTCRMGVDDPSVVDPELRVHGVARLRVADASICPHVVGGNTNAGVVMIAEKAADLIRGRAPPAPLDLPAGAAPATSGAAA